MASDIVTKALSVATGGNITDFLPEPMAARVIDYIRDINIVRGLVDTITMPGRTYKIPSRASGLSTYYAADGQEAIPTQFTSGSTTLTAKKLFSQTIIDAEAQQDSLPSAVEQILIEFARAIAEAEEKGFLQGNTAHTATAQLETDATDANWYIGDPRRMFTGLFPLADSSVNSNCATEVDAGGADITEEMILQLMFNLGKYSQNKKDLVIIMDLATAYNMRKRDVFKQANYSGLALSSVIDGLGQGRQLTNGLVHSFWGVKAYEASQAPAGKLIMFKKSSPIIGDRRAIKVASAPILQTDQTRYVVSERIAFANQWDDAIGRITSLSETVGT